MDRRKLLRILASAAVVPALGGLSPRRLLAVAQATHARLQESGGVLRILDARQAELVDTISELIIPETDTPGARAARVYEFVDLIVADWYEPQERERFLDGLADLDARSREGSGADFLELTEQQQVNLLLELDAEVQELRGPPEPSRDPEAIAPVEHFFDQVKWLTLYGYYTSEVGIREELQYPTIPGRYDPCVATGLRPAGGS